MHIVNFQWQNHTVLKVDGASRLIHRYVGYQIQSKVPWIAATTPWCRPNGSLRWLLISDEGCTRDAFAVFIGHHNHWTAFVAANTNTSLWAAITFHITHPLGVFWLAEIETLLPFPRGLGSKWGLWSSGGKTQGSWAWIDWVSHGRKVT